MLAGGGARSLTHLAVDRSADIATGSTSYYFRTRDALVAAAVDRIRQLSRRAFEAAAMPEPLNAHTASAFIAEQLHALVTERRAQALATIALLPEIPDGSEDRQHLMDCLFSRELAVQLTAALGHAPASQKAVADDLVDLLVGRLISLLFLPHPIGPDSRAATRSSIERLLHLD